MQLEVVCRQCGKQFTIELDREDLERWQAGMQIQVALPYLTAIERELLISRTCGVCFDRLFRS